MFKYFSTGDLHLVLAIVAFALTATVFAVGIWRACRLRPEKREHLASLPLEDDAPTPASHPQSHGTRPTQKP